MNKSSNNGVRYIFTAFITLKDGTRIYAKDYGLKAFCIPASKKN